MSRPVHPNKDIEAAVAYAEASGWRYVPSNGHPWGRLFCAYAKRGGCIMSVWSTPKDPVRHSQQIRRNVSNCPH